MGTARRPVRPAKADQHQVAPERYAGMLDVAGVAFWTVDAHLRITDLNAACARLLGANRTDLIGRPLLDCVRPDRRDAVRAQFERQIAESIPEIIVEFPLAMPAGEDRWVQQTAVAVVKNGRVVAVDAVLRDQPARSTAESPLGNREGTFGAIINHIAEPVVMKDVNGVYTFINAAGERMINRSRDQILGRTDAEIFGPESATRLRQSDLEVMTTRQPLSYETTYTAGDRSRRAMVTKLPDVSADGEVTGVIAIGVDRTEQTHTEDRLHERDQIVSAVVDRTRDIVFIKDLEGRYLYVNEACARSAGKTIAEMIGLLDYDLAADELIRLFRETDQQVITSGQPITFDHEANFSGEKRHYSALKFPLRSRDGSIRGVVGVLRDVTELKHAQAQLEKNEHIFRAVIENSRDNIFIKDRDGRYILANPAFARTEGWTVDDIIGRTDDELYEPERAQFYRELDRQVMETGQPVTVEAAAQLPAGWRTYSAHMFPFTSASGESIGVIGVTRDITAIKEAEEALRQSEERLRTVVEDMTELVCRFRPDTTLTFVNEAYCRLFGLTSDQLIGQKVLNLVPATERRGILKSLESARQSGEPHVHEHWARLPNEVMCWQEWVNRPIVSEDGQVREFQSVGRDMTKRKLAEDARNRYVRYLEIVDELDSQLSSSVEFEHRLDVGIESLRKISESDIGAILLLQDDHLVLTRGYGDLPAWLFAPGLSRDKGIVGRVLRTGRAERVLNVSNDRDYVQVYARTRAEICVPLMAGEHRVGIMVLEASDPAIFTDQVFNFVKILAARLASALENARLYEAMRKQLDELRVLYEKVSGLEQIKTQMIRVASHDLRNPLGVAAGALELLREELGEALPESPREHLQMLRDAIERIDKISRDILTLERVGAGGDMMIDRFDLRDVVRTSGEEFRKQAQQHGLDYSLEIEDSPLHVKGDRVLLRETVANLIGNAIKYTPEGGSVAVRLRAEDDQAAFDVTDTGYGIPEDQQGELFQPFHRVRTKENRHVTGSGLGLHLVKNIIERAGGQIRFQSVYQQGSTFGFTLPLAGRKQRVAGSNGHQKKGTKP